MGDLATEIATMVGVRFHYELIGATPEALSGIDDVIAALREADRTARSHHAVATLTKTFGAAADEIEGLGSLGGDLAVSRTQNLTDTPDTGKPKQGWWFLPLGRMANASALLDARVPVEDAGQRSREAAESTGIEGGTPQRDTQRDPRDAHLDAIRQRLRIECDELGDNTWPDDLHLADVIDRYLCRPVHERIQSLENEAGVLRDRERDAGQQLLAESDRMAKLNGDLYAEVNALREEVRRLTDRERDVEHGVVAEIVGWLRHTHLDVPGDVYAYAQIGDVNRAAEILAEFVAGRIERGDWRAQPATQPTPTIKLPVPLGTCPHGVLHRYPCAQCDAAEVPYD